MAKAIWSKFIWERWLSDAGVRRCSLAARGLWMDMLCVAAQHVPIGYVATNGKGLSEEDLARIAGTDPTSVATLVGELERNGVFSRNREGLIYSRKMVADAKKAAKVSNNLPPSNQKENIALGASPLAHGSSTESLFEEFWRAYPKREGPNPKHTALKSFERAVSSGADPQAIIAGAKEFARREHKIVGSAFVPQAVTWINQKRWGDYETNREQERLNMEQTWEFLLDRESQTGSWPSRQIHKSDIPAEFIVAWELKKKATA